MSRASALSKQKLLKARKLAATSRLRTLTRRVRAPPRVSAPGGGTHTHRSCRRDANRAPTRLHASAGPRPPTEAYPAKQQPATLPPVKPTLAPAPMKTYTPVAITGQGPTRSAPTTTRRRVHMVTLSGITAGACGQTPAPKHPHLAHFTDAPPTLTGPGLGRGVTPPPHLDVAPHHRRSPPHPPLPQTGTVAATAITSVGIAGTADIGGLARRVPMAAPAPSSPVHLHHPGAL